MSLAFLIFSFFIITLYPKDISTDNTENYKHHCSQLHNFRENKIQNLTLTWIEKLQANMEPKLRQAAYYGSYIGGGGVIGAAFGSLAAGALAFTIGPAVLGVGIVGAIFGGIICHRTYCICENPIPINNGTVCQHCQNHIHV